jgi:hypothetical protein
MEQRASGRQRALTRHLLLSLTQRLPLPLTQRLLLYQFGSR